MDRFGVQTALLAYAGINRRVSWWDPERWALVFREADARVFVRRLPRFAALIAARRDPRDIRVLAGGRDRDVPLEKRARRVARSRMRVAAAARRPHVRPRRDAVDAHAGRLRPRTGGAGGLPAARRRGAPLRLAGRDRAGGGPRGGRLAAAGSRARARRRRAHDAGEPRRRAGSAGPQRRRGGSVDRGDCARRRFAAVGAGARAPRPAAWAVDVRRQTSRTLDIGPTPTRAGRRTSCSAASGRPPSGDPPTTSRAPSRPCSSRVDGRRRRPACSAPARSREVEVEPAPVRGVEPAPEARDQRAEAVGARRGEAGLVAARDGAQNALNAAQPATSLPSASLAWASFTTSVISPSVSAVACAGGGAPARPR